MSYVSLPEVKQWFNSTKLAPGFAVDPELEATMVARVLGTLQDTYTTTGWTDAASTPPLVRKIISMFIASWYYQIIYSDDNDLSNFGQQLRAEAERWLAGVVSGQYDLGISFPPSATGNFMTESDFWPNDTTEEGPYFLMGTVF
jgi:hypothetical protein